MSAPVVVKQFPLEQEYAKNTGVTPEDVAKLRTWLATQPHLPGDLITGTSILFPLKVRAHDGSAVLYCAVTDPDAKKFVYNDCARAVLQVLELWQEEEGSWPGLQIVFDFRIFTLQHFAKINIQTAQQFYYYLQEAMLVKVKALHVLNAPSFMDKMMALFRPFLNKSLLDCLFIHQTGSTTLDTYLPMDGLPKEAGGNYTDLVKATEDLQDRFRLNKEFFERESRRRVAEARRPGRPKTISDVFGGVEGSFKKLDID